VLKVGICGHFGGNHNFLDGQTIKVKSLTEKKTYKASKEMLSSCKKVQKYKMGLRS